MIIGVLGPDGMLGNAVINHINELGVDEPRFYRHHKIRDKLDVQAVTRGCDVIINCIGKIPIKCQNSIEMIHSNSVVPHILANEFRGPIFHVSTDKVFDGLDANRTYYAVGNSESPTGLYGRSKLLGEVKASHVCNIRTSFIGKEHGLLNWFLNQHGTIQGYFNAYWSGSLVEEVAAGLVKLLDTEISDIEHLATEKPIRKYDLLCFLKEYYHREDLKIDLVREPIQNFSLFPTTITLKTVQECLL